MKLGIVLTTIVLAFAGAPKAETTVPSRPDGLVMAVRATVAQRPIWFDLDTGGTHTIIDTGIARQLHLPIVGKQRLGGAGAGTVTAIRLGSFDISLHRVKFRPKAPLALDLSNIGSTIEEGGILGYDFFERYVVELDYDHQIVRLYDPRSYVFHGNGSKIPLVLKPPRAYVMVQISAPGVPKQPQLLRLDTGSSDAADSDIVLHSNEPKKPITAGVGIGSKFQAYLGTVSELDIGPYELKSLPSATGGVQLIGDGVWSRFNVVLDFSRSRMYLTPRSWPALNS
jgi:Aspartyl protease